MRNLVCQKFKGLLTLSLFLPLLAACAEQATPPPPVSPPADQTSSQAPTEPLACTEFPALRFEPGDPVVTVQTLAKAVQGHPDDALSYARGELGDTKSTRDAIASYQAKRQAIHCLRY